MNDQSASPLFQIPPEIRNTIFTLSLTAYEDTTKRYRRDAYYCRPGYTCAHKIDTNLLLTCRLVYSETARLPARINEHVSWYHRAPPGIWMNEVRSDDFPGALVRRRDLRAVHIFVQQYWLENEQRGFGIFPRLWNYARPTHLVVTLRHSDWWWWEDGEPIALDPKRQGKPSAQSYSQPSDPFEPGSWGTFFRFIMGLEVFQLELETVESKKSELDAIVGRAKSWEFTLGDGRTLIFNESKKRRTGWVGIPLGLDFSDDGEGMDFSDDGEVDGDDDDDDEDDSVEQSATMEAGQPEVDGEVTATSRDVSPDTTLVGNGNDVAVEGPSAFDGAGGTPPTSDPAIYPERSTKQQAEDEEAVKVLSAPRYRLEADGVVFDSASIIPQAGDEVTTYYVVTLTWEAH
ncbi:MAG: hypothetical protein Q9183_004452 [Haloplaca sp. 2 TL-2023]